MSESHRIAVCELRFAQAVGETKAGDLLIRTMLWRARRHLQAGNGEAADAILAFLPEPTVRAFLDWFFEDRP